MNHLSLLLKYLLRFKFIFFKSRLYKKSCSVFDFRAMNSCDPAVSMDSSTNFQAPPQAAHFLWSCDKVYHKQEVCFILYFLGQIVSWQYNPNLLDVNWPCTVINDHDWQLWICPLCYLLNVNNKCTS